MLILVGLSQVVFAENFLVHGGTTYNITGSTGPANWTAGYGCFDSEDDFAGTNNLTGMYELNITLFNNADTNITNISLTFDTKYLNASNAGDEVIANITINVSENGTGDQVLNDAAIDFNASLVTADGENVYFGNETSTWANSTHLEISIPVAVNYSLCDEVVTEIEIRTMNDTVSIHTLNLTIGVDSRPPRITFLNATDAINNLTDDVGAFNGTSWLQNGSNIIIVIEADDNNNGWGLTNDTTLCFANNNNTGIENCVDNANVGTVERTNATSYQAHNTTKNIYHFVLDAANFSNGTGANLSFVLWVEDVFNHSKTYNNTNIWYSFRTDGENPTTNLVLPDDTTIFTRRSIELKCNYDDGYSGINGTILRVTKPGGSATDYSLGTSATAQTLTDSDTLEAGTYTAQCLTDDNVLLTGSSTSGTFTVSHQVTASGSAAAASLGAISVDMDFSKQGVTKRTFVKTKGSAIEFSLDGKTEHKITVDSINEKDVKLTIASTPSEASLGVGESVEIDVDDDGAKDIKVTLKSTETLKEQATLDVEKIEGQVTTKPTVGETEEVNGGEGVTSEPSSKTGLMIAIAIILIGIIVYFLVFGKKKKKKR